MPTTTVRIPEEQRCLLKIVTGVEKREIKDILTELIPSPLFPGNLYCNTMHFL